jgi:hypothetical protein
MGREINANENGREEQKRRGCFDKFLISCYL